MFRVVRVIEGFAGLAIRVLRNRYSTGKQYPSVRSGPENAICVFRALLEERRLKMEADLNSASPSLFAELPFSWCGQNLFQFCDDSCHKRSETPSCTPPVLCRSTQCRSSLRRSTQRKGPQFCRYCDDCLRHLFTTK